MRSASCILPLKNKRAKIIGIGVRALKEERNECVEQFFVLDYLFARKWLMIRSAVGFIAFPGGFGTLDELMEVMTLMYMKEIPYMPVVLVGVEYWKDFMVWAQTDAVQAGLIDPEQLKLFVLTDQVDEIVRRMKEQCQPYINNYK